jgi:hypothetical protein
LRFALPPNRPQRPVLHVAPVTARCNHCPAPPGTRRAHFWAARDALRCTRRTDLAALVRAAHDSDRVDTRPLHSQLSRCASRRVVGRASAVERALQASWCSDPPVTSKRRPRPWCSTLPVPKVPGPLGRPGCRREWGAPGRRQGQGAALQGACRKAPFRPGPSSAIAWPGSARPGGCLDREVPAGRPEYPAVTLMARFSLKPPCRGDGGGFRITSIQ